jgi:hypothetical protein
MNAFYAELRAAKKSGDHCLSRLASLCEVPLKDIQQNQVFGYWDWWT